MVRVICVVQVQRETLQRAKPFHRVHGYDDNHPNHPQTAAREISPWMHTVASIWFENWGVVGPGLKTRRLRVLKVQQKEECSTGFRAKSPKNLFNIHKSVYFCKVTTLESVLISYFFTLQDIIEFHGDPTTPTLKSPPGLMPMDAY